MRAASTRRTLFAAAGSVVMGSGITAGAAASIADMVPRGSADAHLLAVCAKAEEEDRLLSAADRQHDLMQKCGSAAEVSKALSSDIGNPSGCDTENPATSAIVVSRLMPVRVSL